MGFTIVASKNDIKIKKLKLNTYLKKYEKVDTICKGLCCVLYRIQSFIDVMYFTDTQSVIDVVYFTDCVTSIHFLSFSF